jgi:hypothetical protein
MKQLGLAVTDQFEGADEETVRDNLARGAYSSRRAKRAEAWLQKRDRAKADAAASERTRIDRGTKNATWTVAIVGIITTVVTAVGIVITYYAMKGGH